MEGGPAGNPFATRYVRPDAATYLPLQTPPVAELAARFDELGRRAQIVGPHGVGKSTLLAALARELEARGHEVRAVTLHAGERRLPASFETALSWSDRQIAIVDGAEQLSWLRRRALLSKASKRGSGLLVTTHADLGLPTLCELSPRAEDALVVARALDPAGVVTDEEIAATFARRKGDFREMLFDLFDLYRSRTFDPRADDRNVPATLHASPPSEEEKSSIPPRGTVRDDSADGSDRADSSGE